MSMSILFNFLIKVKYFLDYFRDIIYLIIYFRKEREVNVQFGKQRFSKLLVFVEGVYNDNDDENEEENKFY